MDLKEASSILQLSKEDKERRQAEEGARKVEEARQKLVSELSTKLAQTPQNISNLEAILLKTYNEFVHTDEKAEQYAKVMGVEWTRTIKDTTTRQLVERIQGNLQETVSRINGVKLDEDMSLEDAQKVASGVLERVDGVSYAIEVTKSFQEIVELNEKQREEEMKRKVYDRVQTVIREAKVQKYTVEKERIQGESIGFLGRLLGKEELKGKRLENLDLKIKLAQRNILPENDEYSVRQMLVDMHICANTELGGEFTPEMQELYQAIMNTYGEKSKDIFSERNIRRLISQRQASNQTTAELPVVRGNRPRIFGKTKAQTDMVELENKSLRQKLLRLRTTNSLRTGRGQQSQEPDAISLLEKRLKGIVVNTQERDRKVDLEITLDLWA